MRSAIDDYRALRDRITREAERLFAFHRPHLKCARGCYYCCDAITVLPIEIEAVRQWIERNGLPDPARLGGPPDDQGDTPHLVHDRSTHGVHPNPDSRPSSDSRPQRCGFLGTAGECTIYGGRPLICRTHGLPLAYRVYEYDEQGRELHPDDPDYVDLWCDLNFTGRDGEAAIGGLTDDTRINMAAINEELDRLNARFIAEHTPDRAARPDPEQPDDRYPLSVLLKRPR
ncbi:MAG: YkgJ family cysteine cluster protein [Spirochaetaceae bacterium]|nr:MAG: YkgJ family cysteine cluster protein [Spirochaetaceae bacterium]